MTGGVRCDLPGGITHRLAVDAPAMPVGLLALARSLG
jgi:hypothetical protein